MPHIAANQAAYPQTSRSKPGAGFLLAQVGVITSLSCGAVLKWFPVGMRVMPAALQQLTRHESIESTLKYDVGRDAQLTAGVLWEAVGGNSLG